MKKVKQLYVVLYFILNIVVTYLVTSSYLNPNIVSFKLPITNDILSVVGNFSVLLLLLLIGMFFVRKERNLFKYIIFISLFLNLFIFVNIYFTRNFKAMLSLHNLTLFRNPDAGFTSQVIIDGLTEMLTGIQVLCFLPSVILTAVYFVVRKKLVGKNILIIKRLIYLLIISLISSFLTVFYFRIDVSKKWPFRSEYSLYGVTTCGLYNYYLAEVLGMNYNDYFQNEKEDNLTKYNNINDDIGIFSGMNLFVIQAEALGSFVINLEYDNKIITPHLNSLLQNDDVYYFSNVHSVVGMGNTSDAEFAFNTGYYPLGDLTIVWDAYDNLFDLQSLPKMFSSYLSYAYNPTIEGFYAHKYVFENFYNFNSFKGFETHQKLYPSEKYHELYLHKKWVSDEAVLDLALADAKKVLGNNNFYVFAQTISPHYPFVNLPYYEKYNSFEFKTDRKFQNYLNQVNYIDEVLYEFLMLAKDELENTIFLIYGDHGNTLPKKGYEKILGCKLTDIQYRKLLLEIPVIFYDPSGKLNDYISSNGLSINYDRVLSQIDLFMTIKSLFALDANHLLGIDMFSNDKSFSLDPKNLDVISDDFFYSLKNGEYQLYRDVSYQDMIGQVLKIKEFKIANDTYLSRKIYKSKGTK